MIPNLLNKIKVVLNIGVPQQQRKQPKKQEKKQETEKEQPKNTHKEQQCRSIFQKQQNKPNIQTMGKHRQSQREYVKQRANKKSVTQMRQISIQQLSQHSEKKSAWLSLDGVIYDVTEYLKYHPGGEMLMQGCGKECRKLFSRYLLYAIDEHHPWVNGKNLLTKYKIGYLHQ